MSAENQAEKAAPKKLVLSLVRRLNETKTRTQSIAGEIGVEIKEAAENKHLHSGALKAVAKLVRMDEEKRNAFRRSYRLYEDYAETAGLFGQEHTGDLVEQAEAEADADPAEEVRLGDIAESNVSKLRRWIGQLDEGSAPSEDAATA